MKKLFTFDRMEKFLIDRLKDEITLGLKEVYYSLTFLTTADLCALFFSLLLSLSIFLPWLSWPGFLTITGVLCGESLHLMAALLVFREILKLIFFERNSYQHAYFLRLRALRMRVGLRYILYGSLSTSSNIIYLFYTVSQQDITGFIDIKIGFYLSLLCGIIIIACGLERFRS